MALVIINCRQASSIVTDFLEGALKGRQRSSFLLHILMCRDCRRHLKKMRQLINSLHNLPESTNITEKEEPC